MAALAATERLAAMLKRRNAVSTEPPASEEVQLPVRCKIHSPKSFAKQTLNMTRVIM